MAVLTGVAATALHAQFQMPDPKQMSGIPRPVDDLPNGSVSVRLIRGSLSNNITNFPVELHTGSDVKTVTTDENGRARFDNLRAGATVKAVAVVDDERLESQEFPAPSQGGIRLLLVATDKSKGLNTEPAAPPISGQVVIGGQSRLVIQPGDEVVQVYYLLDIVNRAWAPVNPPAPFAFDLPAAAAGATSLEGSSPQVSVDGRRVRVEGPFEPGGTLVRVAYELPVTSGSLEVAQPFPAAFEELTVAVRKLGDTKLTSPQLSIQEDLAVQGGTFIAAGGGAVAAGVPIVLSLDNLPHHSAAPRRIALSLVVVIIVVGVWASRRGRDADTARAVERKRLIVRREKLLTDLIRLENDRRNGKIPEARYTGRREAIITSLERIYGALEGDDTGPGPADRTGLAA